MTDHPPVHPLRARAVEAIRSYRATGDRAALDTLRQDGHRDLAHALTCERLRLAGDHTERIERFLTG